VNAAGCTAFTCLESNRQRSRWYSSDFPQLTELRFTIGYVVDHLMANEALAPKPIPLVKGA
jgi:hypothetical protein